MCDMRYSFCILRMRKSERGEIATIIALGTVIVLGITALVSSVATSNRERQTTQTSAAANCDSEDWYCAGECANDAVRSIFNGTYPPDGSDEWRNEKAGNCGITEDKCSTTASCTVPSPTPDCEPGKLNQAGACDPACCDKDSQCGGKSCSLPNGYCQSGLSCTSGSNPQYVRKCVSKLCVWTQCTQEEINNGDCTTDTNNPSPQSLKCDSNAKCGTTSSSSKSSSSSQASDCIPNGQSCGPEPCCSGFCSPGGTCQPKSSSSSGVQCCGCHSVYRSTDGRCVEDNTLCSQKCTSSSSQGLEVGCCGCHSVRVKTAAGDRCVTDTTTCDNTCGTSSSSSSTYYYNRYPCENDAYCIWNYYCKNPGPNGVCTLIPPPSSSSRKPASSSKPKSSSSQPAKPASSSSKSSCEEGYYPRYNEATCSADGGISFKDPDCCKFANNTAPPPNPPPPDNPPSSSSEPAEVPIDTIGIVRGSILNESTKDYVNEIIRSTDIGAKYLKAKLITEDTGVWGVGWGRTEKDAKVTYDGAKWNYSFEEVPRFKNVGDRYDYFKYTLQITEGIRGEEIYHVDHLKFEEQQTVIVVGSAQYNFDPSFTRVTLRYLIDGKVIPPVTYSYFPYNFTGEFEHRSFDQKSIDVENNQTAQFIYFLPLSGNFSQASQDYWMTFYCDNPSGPGNIIRESVGVFRSPWNSETKVDIKVSCEGVT